MTPGQGTVRVWRELVEAEIHICTRHPDSVRIVRAIRYLRCILVSRIVHVIWTRDQGRKTVFLKLDLGAAIDAETGK